MLIRYPVASTVALSVVVVFIAMVLSVSAWELIGQRVPGARYQALSALFIAALLAPVFLYPWISTAARLHQATAEMRRMAYIDALTGLPNMVALRERMARRTSAFPTKSSFAVLFIDLDSFKRINDTLGHPTGDALLVAVSEQLRRAVGEDNFIARFGGDEFVALQTPIRHATEAANLAGQIVQAVSACHEVDGHEILVSASIGIAVAPDDGIEATQLLRNADIALYQAKCAGKGTWRFFDPDMARAAQARRNVEIELRSAVSDSRLAIHFQPIFDLRTRRITVCEALVRWRGSDGRLIPPSEFIPLAEDTGIIFDLGRWVLEQACMECSVWPDDVRVSVNLSPFQFRRGDIAEVVSESLRKAQLPPDRLELEITESALLQDLPTTQSQLRRLRDMGVRIVLDDFGTGYSALSYLNSFLFDKVKIDRSFVERVTGSDQSRRLLAGVAQLNAALGITVTVEGVETEEQLAVVMSESSVHEAQGFLLAVPMPSGQIAGYLVQGDQGACQTALDRLSGNVLRLPALAGSP